MSRLVPSRLALACVLLLGCKDGGQFGGVDAAPDLGLPPQVTHIGVSQPACCLETTRAAWRVMYLASPKPGGSDNRGNDIPTKGELHLADAYGADLTLAADVPRGGYVFSEDGRMAIYLSPTSNRDGTYALKIAALPSDTLGPIDSNTGPITVIDRGLDDLPLEQQAFFSPTGRYLIAGVLPKGVTNSSDVTVVEVATARKLFSLPNGSFNYIEAVTSNDVMVYQNVRASKVPGKPSIVGLYVLPLAAAAAGGNPALIDDRTVNFTLTADEQRILYTRYDGALWMYDLRDKSRVQLASNVVTFTVGADPNGPVVWSTLDRALHVARILQPEIVTTAPGAVDVWSTFLFSPSGQDLYFFDRLSTQDDAGDLYRLGLKPGAPAQARALIERRVSQSDFEFIGQRMRFLRGMDGRGEVGELVTSALDGSDLRSIARGVAAGSLRVANPVPLQPQMPRGQPPVGPIDMSTPIIPPVYAHLMDAHRDGSRRDPLFDDSAPIVGSLAFARADEPPVVLDPAVHISGYRFSPDGYVLVYAGGATLNDDQAAYVGTLRLFQTLVDQAPVVPMLNGVSEIGRIRDHALFVAAPGASPPGVYFVRY